MVKYNNKKIVGPINVEFSENMTHVIIGNNGAGKSTLLKLILSLIKPIKGEINKTSHLSFAPDNINFPSSISAMDCLVQLSMGKVDNKDIETILRKFGLIKEKNMKVSTFSSGMKQRLNLSQCFLNSQEVMILDEPTNTLDIHWITKLEFYIKEKKSTVILTTHQLDFALKVADKMYYMEDGCIITIPAEVMDSVETLQNWYENDKIF